MSRIKLLASITVLFFTVAVWAQNPPVAMLEEVSGQILGTLKENQAVLRKNPQVIYQAVERYLLPHVDVEGMSRSVLGRQAWMKASPLERKKFAAVFTQLVIRTYATPLAEYTDETVQFLPVRGSLSGSFLRVNSIIVRANGRNVPLTYSLVTKQGQWKIYDLSVEGVSLLQSFRAQFAQALQHADMNDLIREMRTRAQAA